MFRRATPEQSEGFRTGAGTSCADADPAEAYYRLLEHSDAAVREQAAISWCEWEASGRRIRDSGDAHAGVATSFA